MVTEFCNIDNSSSLRSSRVPVLDLPFVRPPDRRSLPPAEPPLPEESRDRAVAAGGKHVLEKTLHRSLQQSAFSTHGSPRSLQTGGDAVGFSEGLLVGDIVGASVGSGSSPKIW